MQLASAKNLRRIAGASVVALALLALTAPQLSRAQDNKPAENLDNIELDNVVDPNAGPVDADAILRLWGRKLKIPIFIDQQMAGTKIKFLQSDVKLTWGLFKRILDFYDI